ncbi:hypothetical protein D3C87_1720090 [compost metagenome]
MQCPFHINARRVLPAFAVFNVSTVHFGDFAVCIFHYIIALDNVRAFQTDHFTGSEAEVLLRRYLHEIFFFNKNLTGERNIAVAGRNIFRVVFTVAHFRNAIREVGNDHFQRIEHDHSA